MKRKRSIFISPVAVFAAVAMTYLYVTHYYNRKQQLDEIPGKSLVRVRNFPVLAYPMNLTDAADLVQKLRSGQLVDVRPINQEYMNISYIVKPDCDSTEGYDILILIKSRASSLKDRMYFRNIWANSNYLAKFKTNIKYAFVMGYAKDTKTKDSLRNETGRYGDILMGNFQEVSHYATHKTMLGIRWAVEFCSNFKFYVSFDDDGYISIPNLIKFLRDPYNYPEELNGEGTSFGSILQPSEHFYSGFTFLHGQTPPSREKKQKPYLTLEEYPLLILPFYVASYFVAMSRETVYSFYHLSPYVAQLSKDDIYLGLLANKLKLLPLDMVEFVGKNYAIKYLSITSDSKDILKNYIFIENMARHGQRTKIWEMFNEPK